MKFYWKLKMLLLCVLFCALGAESARGEFYAIQEAGATGSAQAWMGTSIWAANMDYLYPASVLSQFYVPRGIIKSIGFKYSRRMSDRDDLPPQTTIRIYLANTDKTILEVGENLPASDPGWTLVFEYENFNFANYRREVYGVNDAWGANEWADLIFNTGNEFRYEGNGLLMKVCRIIPTDPAPAPIAGNVQLMSIVNTDRVEGSMMTYKSGTINNPATQSGVPVPDYCDQPPVGSQNHGNRYPIINLNVEIPAEEAVLGDNTAERHTFIPATDNKRTHYLGIIPASAYFDEAGGILGTINTLSFKVAGFEGTQDWPAGRTLKIYMGIMPDATSNSLEELVPGAAPETWSGWQLVYERQNFSPANLAQDNGITANYQQGDWLDFKFNAGTGSFAYPISAGDANLAYLVCSEAEAPSVVPYQTGIDVLRTDRTADFGAALHKVAYSATSSSACNEDMADATNSITNGDMPAIKFSVIPSPFVPQEVTRVEVQHPTLEAVMPNTSNVQLLRIRANVSGTDGATTLNKIYFTNKSEPGYVGKVKLYYTGSVAALVDISAPLAEIASMPGDNKLAFELETPVEMQTGDQYFFLAYDIMPNLQITANAIDASFDSLEFTLPFRNTIKKFAAADVLTPDPDGAIPISYHQKIYCPPGVSEPESSDPAYYQVSNVMSPDVNVARMQMTYTAYELGGYPGSLEELAFYAIAVPQVGSWQFDSVFIFMRNSLPNSGNEFKWPSYFTFQRPGTGMPASAQGAIMGTPEEMWGNLMDEYIEDGYTLVAGPLTMPSVGTSNQWVSMRFDRQFRYEGGDLDIIIHRTNVDNYQPASGATRTCDTYQTVNVWTESRYSDSDPNPDPDPNNAEDGNAYIDAGYQHVSAGMLLQANGNAPTSFTNCASLVNADMQPTIGVVSTTGRPYLGNKPNIRLSILYFDGAQYESANAFSSAQQNVALGTAAGEVLGVMINTEGEVAGPFENLTQITFDVKGAGNIATSAKLYYSKDDQSFGSAVQYGDAIPLNSTTSEVTFNLDRNDLELGLHANYLWLAYEIPNNSALVGQKVDAKVIKFTLSKYDMKQGIWRDTNIVTAESGGTITTPDPAGEKTIVSPLNKSDYYIGQSTATQTADYATLADFANAYSNYGSTAFVTNLYIISNISDNRTATFGYNLHSKDEEKMLFIMPTNATTESYKITNMENGGSVIELLSGTTNVFIRGGNSSTGSRLTIEKAGNAGDAIKATHAIAFNVDFTNIIGNTNGINLSGVSGFNFTNNTLARASNYAINVAGLSTGGKITNNSIGSVNGDVSNGLAIVDGSNIIEVTANKFQNITSATDNRAIYISGVNAMRDLSISILNNTINDVKSNSMFASAFEIRNARQIDIAYNTVIFSENRGAQNNSQVLKLDPVSPVSLSLTHNLFVNNIVNSSEGYSQIWYVPAIEQAEITGAGNLYSGGAFYRYGEGTNDFAYFEDWKTHLSADATSSHESTKAFFVSDTDFHTDGAVLDLPQFVVNKSPDYTTITDIDGYQRGASTDYSNKTTVGADEVLPVIIAGAALPAKLETCESTYESILLKYDRRFDRYEDNVARSYSPVATNIWITDKGDTLESENGIDVSRLPYLYIELPNYTHTMKVQAVSNIHNEEAKSNFCEIIIIKAPSLLSVSDVNLCYDAGKVEIETANLLEGIAEKYQWQKRSGTTWTNIVGQTSSKLELSFTSDDASIAQTAGIYRLQLTPYGACNDATGSAVNSNEINVRIGNPIADLDAVELTTSLDDIIEQETIDGDLVNVARVCVNNEIWFIAGLAVGTDGEATQYQWEKYHPATDTWNAVLPVNNETSQSDTFRIYSTRSEHTGLYRCAISGCSTSDVAYSSTIRVEVEPASEILQQPNRVVAACVGKPLRQDGVFATVTDPADVPAQKNIYQWYKDGKPYIRYDASGNPITSPTHPFYAIMRTDTTYLQFSSLKAEDAGAYTLLIEYINCEKNWDELFSDTTNLYVYATSKLKSQSKDQYATVGGYSELYVSMTNADGNSEIPSVTYKWYRRVGTVDTEIKNSAKYSGATTDRLRINNINAMDINAATGDYYYCVATEYCNNSSIMSAPMLLKAAPEINITAQPQGAEVCAGVAVSITANATSTEAGRKIIYTWYKTGNSTPISSGIDNTTLTFSAAELADAASYYCVVSFVDFVGANKQTETVVLAVNPVPTIIEESYPTDGTVAENSSFELKVVTDASTGPYTYQWYLNGVAISGATGAVYSVASAKNADEGEYYVVVKNKCSEKQGTTVEIKITVGIEANMDPSFRVISVLPNPVADYAVISFALPDANNVSLTLLDVNGKSVIELYSGVATQGENTVQISNKLHSIASGTYFVLLESNGRKTSFKINISK